MSDRPPLREVQRIDVAESDGDEWVEVFMEVNHCGDACEPFMVEWFPNGNIEHDLDAFNTRVINPDVFEEQEQLKYQLFASIAGRLTLHD